MRKFSTYFQYFFTGMGLGAITYLCILTFFYRAAAPTVIGTTSVLILSGFIGLLSMVMRTDLPFTISLAIHLVGTFFIFWLMVLINHWGLNWWNIFLFFLIYVIIWLICLLEQRTAVHRINDAIRKKRAQN